MMVGGEGRMFRPGLSVALVILLAVSGLIVTVPQEARAGSGTITIAPGETKYVSLGAAVGGDLLLWSLSIDTWSTILQKWLQSPDGAHIAIEDTDGEPVGTNDEGEWKLGFAIDSSGWWDATVTYSTYKTHPYSYVTSPVYQSYTNSDSVDIKIYAYSSPAATSMWVSIDGLSYQQASVTGGVWTATMALGDDGWYSVRTQQRVSWGSCLVYYSNNTNAILKDTVLPESRIITPSNDSWVSSPVDLEWQCSDDQTGLSYDVKVDVLGWWYIPLTGYTGHTMELNLDDGPHVVQVRVTDLAGNVVVKSVSFSVDSGAPQVSITSPGVNAKLSKSDMTVTWTGTDSLSGIDHYEVQIGYGQWVNVGTATSYQFTNLDDAWHSVKVKAVDKSGNTATSTVGFGIYTSVWSTNGPYQGIPLFALIGGIVAIAALSLLLWHRKGKSSPQEPVSEDAPKVA